MVSLGSELINNIQICNLLETEKEIHLQGIEVPSILFEYSVMNNMIMSGDITSHKLRAELSSLIVQMKALNNLINTQQYVITFKNFAPKDRRESLKLTTITSMELLHKKVPLIKQQLINAEPLFKEQWNNPERFIDQKYLQDKMLPDGLMP